MSILPLERPHTLALPRVALGGGAIATLMAVAHVSNDALSSMLSALLPSLQGRLGLTETTLAILVAALACSSSVTQPVFGALSDRFGARRVAAVGTTFGVSLMSLITVVPNVGLLFVLLLVGGLGSAAFHPAGTSVVGAAPLARRELGVSLFSAGGTVGLALGPLLVLGAAATLGLGFTPWLIVPAVALGATMYLLVPEAPRAPRAERARILDRALFTGPVGRLAAIATLSGIAFVTFSAGYPLYLVSEYGLRPSDPVLGATLATFNFAAAGGAIAAAALSGRAQRRRLVAGTTAAAIVPLLVLLHLAPGGVAYFLAVAAAGALLNAGLPALLVAAHEHAPTRKAAASGMLMGLPIGVAGLLYVAVGRLQEALGVGPAIAIAFGAVLPAALLALVALRTPAPAGEGDRPSLAVCACTGVRACGSSSVTVATP